MKVRKKDFSWSYLATILGASVGVILLPFVLYFLDDDELGLWYVFSSLNTMILLLDFGFTPTIARNIAYSWSGASGLLQEGVTSQGAGEFDDALFETVLQTCRFIFAALSLAATAILATAGTMYIYAIASSADVQLWMISWVIYACAVVLNLYYGYLSSFLRGIGAVAENAQAQVIFRLLQLCLTVALLFLGAGLLGTSISYLISCLIMRLVMKRAFYNFEGMDAARKNETHIEITEIRDTFIVIWHNAWRDGLVSLALFCGMQASTLICSYAMGLASAGVYGLVMQVATAITSFASVHYSTIQPRQQEYALAGNDGAAIAAFAKSIIVYNLLGITCFVLFITLGIPIIKLIRPGFDIEFSLLIVVCLYMLLFKENVLFVSCISNYNTIPYSGAYVVSGVLSSVLSLVAALYTPLGLWSLVLPQLVVFLLYNGWKWPKFVFDKFGTSILQFSAIGIKGLRSNGKN